MRTMPDIRSAGFLAAVLISLGLLLPATAQAAPANVVTVDSRSGWVAVQVEQGQLYQFKATGDWTVDRRSIRHVSAVGYPATEDKKIYQGCKVAPNLAYGNLIAKVGPYGNIKRAGEISYFRGDGTRVVYLRINDVDRCLGDNEGSLTVTVRPW